MDNPVAAVTPSKNTIEMIWKVFLSLLALGFIFGILYWALYLRGVSWVQIKALIKEEAGKYKQPIAVEQILMQGSREIITNINLMKQAREYSKATGIGIERVIVDNSVALAKNLNYIN